MTAGIVVINPKEFGIEENKASELIGNLPQITIERKVLEEQYSGVILMDIEDPKTANVARELRLKIRDNRTKGLNVWHKTTKDVFLRAGQFIDALKNREVAVNERMEENLQEIELHFERKEQARKEALKQERFEILRPYAEFFPNIDLANATEEDFSKALNGSKLQFDAKVQAEQESEAQRQRAEQQRILQKEREVAEKLRAEIKAKEDAEKKAIENARIESERIEKERLEALRRDALAPRKQKLKAWVDSFEIPIIPVDQNDEVALEIVQKYNNFKAWAVGKTIEIK